MIGVVMIKYTY